MKRSLATTLAILVVWTAVDAVAHGVLLARLYAASAALWRPMAEMNAWLVMAVRAILAMVFVATYRQLVRPKNFGAALSLGALLGVALGTASGLGTYIHSPISPQLALGWFALGTLKGLVAGAVLGGMVRELEPR